MQTIQAVCQICNCKINRKNLCGRPPKYCDNCKKKQKPQQQLARYHKNKTRYQRVAKCKECAQEFLASRPSHKYCSAKCRRYAESMRGVCQGCGLRCSRTSRECNDCYRKQQTPLVVAIKCLQCKKLAVKRCWNSKTPRYCSRECFFASIKAETTEEQRKERREYVQRKGSTKHRKRCRKFGGFYNPKVTRLAVLRAGLWRCYICGTKVSDDLPANHNRKATIDHIVPLEKGGPHDWQNVKACCRRCNTKKQAKWDGQNVLDFSSGWEYVNG